MANVKTSAETDGAPAQAGDQIRIARGGSNFRLANSDIKTLIIGAGSVSVASGKTLTVSNTLTFTGTDSSSVAFGVGGTVAYVANKLSVFAATSSAELAGVISDETGSGALVFATSPTLVTPVLGVAAATSINKVAITAPATSATLTIADGKTLTVSNTLTFTGTDGITVAFGAGLSIAAAKVLTVSNTLTFTGTDSSSVAFGAGGTVAYVANKLSVFAATSSAELAGVISDETGSGLLVFATSPSLVTPVLGAATGTSLALGGATLGSNALAVTGTVNVSGQIDVNSIGMSATGTLSISGRGAWKAESDGVWTFYRSDQTTFNRLQFGGTTSSFPAIKRNGAALNFRLADDSADAAITSAAITASGSLTFSTIASGVILKQGANGRVGTFVCNGVTPVTVSNTSIAITDAIIISLNTVGGTVGAVPAIQTITASTGFTVAGTTLDTSTYNYAIIKNAA